MTGQLLPAPKTSQELEPGIDGAVVSFSDVQKSLAEISTPEGLEQIADLDALLEEAERRRHAETTRRTYDYWWSRFRQWLTTPSSRMRYDQLPAFDLSTLTDPNDADTEFILLAWLAELAGGPGDPEAFEEWLNDAGPMSPGSFDGVVTAVKARLEDHTGIEWKKSKAAQGKLTGFRRELRKLWGKDRRATPLLAHHVAAMTTFLATERLPHVVRDLAIVELSVAGLSAAEIARLPITAVMEPAGMTADGIAANAEYFAETGKVGTRSIRVPGMARKGGNADPDRVVALTAHSPLTMAVLEQAARNTDKPYFIDGFSGAGTNRRQRIREVIVAAAKGAGHDWRPTRDRPHMPEAVAADVRKAFAGEHGGEGSMTLATLRRAKRDQAAVWIGLLAALRRSELLALTVGDLGEVAGMHRCTVEIRKSKTDQDMRGVTLVVPGSETRPAHIDPVRCIQAWLQELTDMHGGTLPADTPLFPGINHAGRPNASAMTGQAWSARLSELAEISGAISDPGQLKMVSGHSLRRGFVTDAARRGQTAVQIQRVTRHTDLAALARYVGQLQQQHGEALGVDELLDDEFALIDPSIA